MEQFMSLLSSKDQLQKVFDGEGGSYYFWSSTQFPILGEAKLGAGRLNLKPLGFALPHYADSSKIGYVLEGSGKVGSLLAGDSEEKVLSLKKGNIIAVPLGSISWWFNDGHTDDDFTVVFLGETSKAEQPGNFTYYFLAGDLGLFKGFSTKFLARSLGLEQEEAKKIARSQSGLLIIKLKEAHNINTICKGHDESTRSSRIFNIETAAPRIKVEKGGELVSVTSGEMPLLKEVGLSAVLARVHKNALWLPEMHLDSAVFQMVYIARGSGEVEVVGANGQSVLKSRVEEGQLLVIPTFFVVSKLAGTEGLECFTVLTTPQPTVTSQLVGRGSVWKALAPEIVQVSLNVSPELEKRMRANMSKNEIFVPSPN